MNALSGYTIKENDYETFNEWINEGEIGTLISWYWIKFDKIDKINYLISWWCVNNK